MDGESCDAGGTLLAQTSGSDPVFATGGALASGRWGLIHIGAVSGAAGAGHDDFSLCPTRGGPGGARRVSGGGSDAAGLSGRCRCWGAPPRTSSSACEADLFTYPVRQSSRYGRFEFRCDDPTARVSLGASRRSCARTAGSNRPPRRASLRPWRTHPAHQEGAADNADRRQARQLRGVAARRSREGAARRLQELPAPAAGRALPSQGSYNPDLDAAERAATRGLGQLRQDTELGLARAGQDYTFGREDLNRGLSRGEEDYRTNTQALQRSFNILAGRQQENANAAGVLRGGAMLQAAAKRKENQGIQQGGLDTSIGRLRQDTQTGLGRLDVGYNRQVSDFGTAQQRATDENTFYGQDIAAQRFFQASQPGSGWTPPKPKKPRR